MYTAGIYRSSDGRQRWAVLNTQTRTWIFPERTGRTAAERSARNLNRTAPTTQDSALRQMSTNSPYTLEQAIARNRRKRQLQERRRKMRHALFGAEDRGREHQWRRIVDKILTELFLMDTQVIGTIHESHMPLIRFRMDNPSVDLKGRVQKLDNYTDPSRNDRGQVYSTAWHQVARQIMNIQ